MNSSNSALPGPPLFWLEVDRSAECWEWLGRKHPDGYGRWWYEGKTWPAHRLAYLLVNGAIPDGMHILHNCDNPGCVNPDHLRAGTHAENMADKRIRGRAKWGPEKYAQRLAASAHNAKLSLQNVREIRELYSTGTYSYAQLGGLYGVSAEAIRKVVKGLSYPEHFLESHCARPTRF